MDRLFFAFFSFLLDLPLRMEDDEESESPIPSDKLTRPLILSLVGSSLGFLQQGYIYFMINNPFLTQMHVQTVQKEALGKGTTDIKVLLLLISLIPLGGLFGVYLWGCLADRYGRKSAILISNGFSIFSSAIMCFDKIFRRIEFTFFARFFVGIWSGTLSWATILYILEISSLNLRGTLVITLLLFLSWGYILAEILLRPYIWGNEENYSFLVSVPAVFAILSSILLVLSPESPRFLYLQRNNIEKARQVLKELRGEDDVEDELEELRQEQLAESSQKNMTVWQLLHFRSLRWNLITIVVLVFTVRFVQIPVIIFFIKKSYKTLGMTTGGIPLAGGLIIQLMLLTIIGMVEPLGRRFLLLNGFLLCSISNIALFFSLQIKSPVLALISIVLVIFYLLGFVMGPGSILSVIIGELFLQSSRASAYVIAGIVSFSVNCLVNVLFIMTESYFQFYYLLISSPFMILALIYTFRVVPETSGETFEEIQENMAACTSKNCRKIMVE
ncbi:solute carrier family 2, facilitated glucose transporter member 5-like [Erythrolamprus reginae]|uniref:solute carrier family 2, facilitated glucose transporter member 5-like n=1 Tax=Erythrolamprus reginae TaxID=121349 RepID=UPI00396C79FE